MSRFKLTEAAQADLNGIAAYSKEQWGDAQARAYLNALERGLTRLAQKPALGRVRSDLPGSPRSFPVEQHIAYYRALPDRIVVVRLLHQRQDPVRHVGG